MVALSALKKAGSARRDLYYQFAPTLIQNIPKELVKELIDQGRALNPTKLLPALLLAKESPEASLGAIEYLEFAVYKLKTTDQALHNYLLSLYAQYKPDELINYLDKQGKVSEFWFKLLSSLKVFWLVSRLLMHIIFAYYFIYCLDLSFDTETMAAKIQKFTKGNSASKWTGRSIIILS